MHNELAELMRGAAVGGAQVGTEAPEHEQTARTPRVGYAAAPG